VCTLAYRHSWETASFQQGVLISRGLWERVQDNYLEKCVNSSGWLPPSHVFFKCLFMQGFPVTSFSFRSLEEDPEGCHSELSALESSSTPSKSEVSGRDTTSLPVTDSASLSPEEVTEELFRCVYSIDKILALILLTTKVLFDHYQTSTLSDF